MADELDQAEEVVAAPEPEAASETVVEPAPEPEPEFHHVPEFISNEQAAPSTQQEPQQPQWSPQQIAAYNEQIRQQQAPPPSQYQQPQAGSTEAELSQFVSSPGATIDARAAQQAQNVVGQMMQQYLVPQQQQQQQFIQGQAEYQTSQYREKLGAMYESTFDKDETFKSNEQVRKNVDSALGGMLYDAHQQALMGNPSGYAIFNKPRFQEGVLALAKTLAGHTPTAAEAAAVPHVESTTPSTTAPPAVEGNPDMISALERVGISEERYIKSLEDNAKYDDFQG